MSSKSGRTFAAVSAAAFASATGVAGANQYNLPPPHSVIATQIYDLHTLIMWIIVAIFVVVFGFMTVAIVKHRKSVGHEAQQFHENTTVEIAWTIVPFLILIGMAYPATKTILAYKDTGNPDITIKATGYQWKWGYDYLNEGVSFYSNLATPRDQIDGHNDAARNANPNYLLEVDNPVVVPVGKKIRVITTANDVIHAWWIPAFGVKQDAIPGFVRDMWFRADKVGTYRGQCVELCGKDQGLMTIVVEVVEQDKYNAWIAEQKKKVAAVAVVAADPAKQWTLDELKAQGEKVYAANCVACHQANGMGVPNTFPALSGSKIATGDKAAHVNVVVNGKPGTAMAPFKHLSDVEIASVVTFERNSWDNKTGDMVTPADVKAARK